MTNDPNDLLAAKLMQDMLEAIHDRIATDDDGQEAIFAAYDNPQMVRRAIAGLATLLLCFSEEMEPYSRRGSTSHGERLRHRR